MPYRLTELQASSFRGFADLQLDLDHALVVIGGPNGSGKSSTLNAIAWALAGRSIAQKKIGVVEIPERKGWVVVHDGAKFAQALLLLQDDKRRISVKRSSVRDQCEVRDAASGDDPLAALGLNLDTFLSSVFLPQELLRIPVALDPKERGRIFLDLVGLGSLGELEGTLVECAKVARDRAEAIARARKSIDERISSLVIVKRREIAEQRERARQAGLGEVLDAPDTVERLVERTRAALAGLCERHGVPLPAALGSASGDLGAFVKAVRASLSEIEASGPDVKRRSELERTRLTAAGLLEEAHHIVAKRRALDAEKAALAKAGGVASLDEQKAALEAEIRRLRDEIAAASAQGELLDSALRYFEKLVPGPEPLACPVCQTRPIDLGHVREHLMRVTQRDGVGPLVARKSEAERALRDVQAALDQHAKWSAEMDAIARREESFRTKVGELRGRPVDRVEDVARAIQAVIDEAEQKLEEVNRRIEERGRDVQKVREGLEEVSILVRIQEDRAFLDHLDRLPQEPSYVALKEQEHRAQELQCVAELLKSDLKEERRRAFDAAFAAVQGDVVKWFRRITDRPDCRSLRIDSEKWSLVEESSGGEREVTATFNVGDLTSVALAIFLATATRAAHQAGFALLDDPTQGLDDDHKRRLAEVLAEVATTRQVVVASADEVFLTALEKAGTVGRVVHRLRLRAPGRPCELESSR